MKKNFERVEINEWYVQRNGSIVQVKEILNDKFIKLSNSLVLDLDGTNYVDNESELDLIMHIEPIQIIPKPIPPTPECVNFWAWSNDYGVLQWREENRTDGMQDWFRVPSEDRHQVGIVRRRKTNQN